MLTTRTLYVTCCKLSFMAIMLCSLLTNLAHLLSCYWCVAITVQTGVVVRVISLTKGGGGVISQISNYSCSIL